MHFVAFHSSEKLLWPLKSTFAAGNDVALELTTFQLQAGTLQKESSRKTLAALVLSLFKRS